MLVLGLGLDSEAADPGLCTEVFGIGLECDLFFKCQSFSRVK